MIKIIKSQREETQDSEDELAENIFGPKNNIECSDHEPKFEVNIIILNNNI